MTCRGLDDGPPEGPRSPSSPSRPGRLPRDADADLAVLDRPLPEAREAPEVRPPRLFRVILHNDDYTTMEFVVMCLMTIFHLPEADAVSIMLEIHRRGAGVAGTYGYEVAEARQEKVSRLAREHEYPLKCTLEPA